MNKSYSMIANYYDNFTHNDCDYVSWSQYLFGVAKKHNVKKVVDLACGTGKMTALLVKGGLQVVGVDNSPEMLAIAHGKCRATFVKQDMQKLSLPSLVDMAVCVNDGVNYVAPNKLAEFFAKVSANLKCGCPFVFDLSSKYKLTQVVANNVFYIDEKDQTLLWTNELQGDKLTMSLALFQRQGDVYTRQDETHTQYVHDVDFVATCLRDAGFTLVETSADYGKPLTGDALRITFYATKD